MKNIKLSNKVKKITTSIILYPYSAIKFSINLNLIPTDSKFVIVNVAHLSNVTLDILQNR